MRRQPLRNHTVILVLHLLQDIKGFVFALCELGIDPDRIVIVNIPYSTKPETVASLWTRGVCELHLSSEYPIADAVAEGVAAAEAIALRTGTELLVIEDGGYVGPYVHRSRPELLPRISGIVEQTQNGIWQYDADEETGLPAVELAVPVVNVAESNLKKDLESPLIGRAVYRNVEDLIAGLGYGVEHMRVLVVGYGATGSQVVRTFSQNQRLPVRVFDVDEGKRNQARVSEQNLEVFDDLESAIDGIDLLLGCTGREKIINRTILESVVQDCYFANGSSKRREMDWEALADLQRDERMLPGGRGRVVTLASGHRVTLLVDGYPVNFFGESVPDEEIAFIYGLLLRSALLVAEGGLNPGFVTVPADLQNEIEVDHYRALGRRRPGSS